MYEDLTVALGGNVDELPDRLETTYLKEISRLLGVEPDESDNLKTSILDNIVKNYSGGGSGGGTVTEETTVDLNFSAGDMEVTPASGKSFSKVSIPKPEELKPENILKDVEIAGVTGINESGKYTIVEDVPVTLDLSEGNQIISVQDGYAAKTAIIQKPDTLTPENVLKDINIAGIIGTLEAGGGGGNIVMASGTFTGNGGMVTVEHNLGVMPDLFMAYFNAWNTVSGMSTSHGIFYFGLSNAMKERLGVKYAAVSALPKSSSSITPEASDLDRIGYTSSRVFANESATSIGVGSDYAKTVSGKEYIWIAIGGLL